MFGLPLDLLVSFAVFATFLFYQQKHASEFRGSSLLFGEILHIWGGLGFLLEIGFLFYVGYQMSVWSAIKLFGSGFLLGTPIILAEVVFQKRIHLLPFVISLIGFAVVPVSAYLMIIAVP